MIPARVVLEILDRFGAEYRPIRPPTFLGGAGGTSGSKIWRVETGKGPLALHAWPAQGPTFNSLSQIHTWLGECDPLSFVVQPIRLPSCESIVRHEDRLWHLERWVMGTPASLDPVRENQLRPALAGLASFHQRLCHHETRGCSPGLQRIARELEALQESEAAELLRIVRSSNLPSHDPIARLARQWLQLAPLVARNIQPRVHSAAAISISLQPCIRDARPQHFYFQNDQLIGLIDFGAMGIDCVATDLARLLGEWVGSNGPLRALALDAYESVRPLAPEVMRLTPVFGAAAVALGGIRWIRWHFVDGRRFDDPGLVERSLANHVARLEAALTRPS